MKVISRHGYMFFYPRKKEDLVRFARIFKLEFTSKDDYYTIYGLNDLPRYSFQGHSFGGIPAVNNFEGQHACEVMKANEFVLNINSGAIIPVAAVASVISLSKTADYAIAPGIIIQPGSFLRTGQRIVSYRGEIDLDWQKLYLTDWSST